VRDEAGWRCPETGEVFPIISGAPVFVPPAIQAHMDEERTGIVNRLKTFLRRFPWLYIALIYLIGPVCFVGTSAAAFVRSFRRDELLLNIGSGIHSFGANVLNLDIFWYKGVDVVADAHCLPFETDSVDGVVCEALLEHVPNPSKVIQEITRVLKPGGRAYILVPFVYPFHACPNDFYRWSGEGLRLLCKGTEIVELAPRSGPTSALVAQLGTWAAIVFSFGWEPLYSILSIAFTAIFAPLKWLDLVFGRLPTAIHGTASWYMVFRKPAEPRP
jgi:SAM-dependent methyltransferase